MPGSRLLFPRNRGLCRGGAGLEPAAGSGEDWDHPSSSLAGSWRRRRARVDRLRLEGRDGGALGRNHISRSIRPHPRRLQPVRALPDSPAVPRAGHLPRELGSIAPGGPGAVSAGDRRREKSTGGRAERRTDVGGLYCALKSALIDHCHDQGLGVDRRMASKRFAADSIGPGAGVSKPTDE